MPLALLALLWVAARVLVLTPYGWAAAAANVAFPLAAALALARPLLAARNRRNYFFVGLLLLLAAAALCVHLQMLGLLSLPAWAGIQLALDVVLFIMAVMAGRVVPMFTNNGVRGAKATRHAGVEKLALGSMLLLLAADALQWPAPLLALIAAAARWPTWRAGCCGSRGPRCARRSSGCCTRPTCGSPCTWCCAPLAVLGWVPTSAATHALTVGAAGGLIIGMMTRTARGHTARPLRADRADVACYVLVLGAALVRVALPLALPQWSVAAVLLSAALWSAGFGLYAVRYCAGADATAPGRPARLIHGLRRLEAAAPGRGGVVDHRLHRPRDWARSPALRGYAAVPPAPCRTRWTPCCWARRWCWPGCCG